MSWTGRPDDKDCCFPPGACAPDEAIAKLLHTKNMEPKMEPFKRDVLFGPRAPKTFSNVCGKQDGLSVVRTNTLSNDDVRARSFDLTVGKTETQPEGAYLASIATLRSIRHESLPDQQIVYVYDDPTEKDPLHAIVRASEKLPRVYQDTVRKAIKEAFATRIQQAAEATI